MLSDGSGSQEGMWTKLPAALERITAVHHCTLDDTFHQLNKSMTRRSAGITHCFCHIQKYSRKWEKTLSHTSNIVSRAVCIVHLLNFLGFLKVISLRRVRLSWELREYQSGRRNASFPRAECRTTNQVTGDNGPRLWRWLRSKDLSDWTTAFFGCYKRIFWSDNSQCNTSQIWTVWASSQMAADSILEFAKRQWKILSARHKRLWFH